MLLGGIGFIADIAFLSLNPLDMPVFNRYLTCGVMGALFVLFFIMGILSVKTYRFFSAKATEENNMISEVHAWCEKNLTRDIIDSESEFESESEPELETEFESGFESDADDDILYFRRCEYIKERIQKQYIGIDDELLDSFVDSFYTELFGE